MTLMRAASNGAMLAVSVGLTIAITNGVWQRFLSKDGSTLEQAVGTQVSGLVL
tara:strand:+ start:731 stop:889 length:159 start_codon:yes stop_codon:yes gene_type:complete